MNLSVVETNKEYVIKSVETGDEELESFLFSLGCYEGEKITLISIRNGCYIVAIKDARYSIDKNLAKAISIY